MILAEKPEQNFANGANGTNGARGTIQTSAQAPDEEITTAFCRWRNMVSALVHQAQSLCVRYPHDRDARYLLAETLRGAGMDDLAAREYQRLLQDCPVNEQQRAEQGLTQCRADRGYFPDVLAKRFASQE